MKIVGDLFGAGEMQLPFVLRSAQTMKAAVRYLEPHLDKVDAADRGSIVLATVRGDVHDIGKNLVDIILTNNGYRVHNLGIKVSIAEMIDAYSEHDADAHRYEWPPRQEHADHEGQPRRAHTPRAR